MFLIKIPNVYCYNIKMFVDPPLYEYVLPYTYFNSNDDDDDDDKKHGG